MKWILVIMSMQNNTDLNHTIKLEIEFDTRIACHISIANGSFTSPANSEASLSVFCKPKEGE